MPNAQSDSLSLHSAVSRWWHFKIASLVRFKRSLNPLWNNIWSFSFCCLRSDNFHIRRIRWRAVAKTNKPSPPQDVKITEGTLFSALFLCNFPCDFCIIMSVSFHKSFSAHRAKIFTSNILLLHCCGVCRVSELSVRTRIQLLCCCKIMMRLCIVYGQSVVFSWFWRQHWRDITFCTYQIVLLQSTSVLLQS